MSALASADWAWIGRQLANHLWQSTLFAAAAGLMALALRKNHAGTRHWLWMAASGKFLAPFAVVVAIGSHFAPTVAPRAAGARIPVAAVQIAQPFALPDAAGVPLAPEPGGGNLLPGALLAVWFCGCAAVLVNWLRRWRRVAVVIRESEPLRDGREVEALGRVRWGTEEAKQTRRSAPLGWRRFSSLTGQAGRPAPLWARPLGLVSSSAALEPGVFGIFRPVLWLPKGIGEWLSDAQLEAILAHELCHARRRDNLAAAVHMVVEALFWFHPLVWWMGARLTEERERACDEEVVRLGGEPRAYAEGVLKVCKFCLASPLPCAAGVTGADLKKRIESIMTNRFTRKLSLGKKALLAAVAVLAVAGPIAIGLLNAPLGRGQAAPLRFDVASVKAFNQTWIETRPKRTPGRFTWTTDLLYLICYAFDMQPFRISGRIPGDIPVAYRVDATTSPNATEDQIRLMLRRLLAERFKMVSHIETKEAIGYVLSVEKGRPRLQEAGAEGQMPPLPEWERVGSADLAGMEGVIFGHLPTKGVVNTIGRRVTMRQLCDFLERDLDTRVWDETGLKEKYYFGFRYATEDAPIDVDVPPLLAAIREELGLKLEKRKGPVDMLVVDSIEKMPTEN